MRLRWFSLVVWALGALPGCTTSAGDWFANVTATFEASYVPRADRDVGGGWQKLNTLYQARMTRALVTIETISLDDLGGGSSDRITFDPAHPPAAYSNCHNGHCHASDGRLVPYAEIETELAGGGPATVRTIVTFPVGEADLLAPVRRGLACEPRCGLDEGHARRARATLTRVVFEGLVREGRSPARLEGEVPWRWEAALATGSGPMQGTLDAQIDLPADNGHPPDVRLDLTLAVSARLLDDVEWATLVRDVAGVIDVGTAPNAAAAAQLVHNLAESELTAYIERND